MDKKVNKKGKNLSYIDEWGDRIVVREGEEYVIPTREDMEAIQIDCSQYKIDDFEGIDGVAYQRAIRDEW